MAARTRPKRSIKPVQRHPIPSAPVGTWGFARILTPKSTAACKPVDSYLSLFLITTTGWDDKYDDTERRAIIDCLPTKYRQYEVDPDTGRLLCPIDASFVLDNSTLKQAITKVRDEITEGYQETTWLNQAQKGTSQRRDGAFDGYLKQHGEELFGDVSSSSDDQAQVDEDLDAIMTSSSDGEWSAKGPIKEPKLRQARGQASKACAADAEMEDATDAVVDGEGMKE